MVRVPAPPLNDKASLERFATWARANRAVLHQGHEALFQRHGVDATGITISRPIPVDQSSDSTDNLTAP